jgi:hypothetical protein
MELLYLLILKGPHDFVPRPTLFIMTVFMRNKSSSVFKYCCLMYWFHSQGWGFSVLIPVN